MKRVTKKLILESVESRLMILKDRLTKPVKNKEGKKIPAVMTLEDFYEIVKADPTTRLNNVNLNVSTTEDELNKVKAGKFVQWLLKNYIKPPEGTKDIQEYRRVFIEDLFKMTRNLVMYERYKNKIPEDKRDINNVDGNQELFSLVKDFNYDLASTTKSERKNMEVHPGANLLYDGANWRVIEIERGDKLGHEAACFYGGSGQETQWCTAAPGTNAQFNHYVGQGPLYVIYNPNDTSVAKSGLPRKRYQIHFPSNQFMDEDDRSFPFADRLRSGDMVELQGVFKDPMMSNIKKGNTSALIVDLTSGTLGMYVSIYGLDELFQNSPNTLTKIVIKGKDGLTIDIPNSISKFVKCKWLELVNCIKSLPDSVCNMKELQNLSLEDNVNLKSIPECIGNLPELTFISLGKHGMAVPESIKNNPDMDTFNDQSKSIKYFNFAKQTGQKR